MNHKYVEGKCECGCRLRFKALPGKGTRRIYSLDGFVTFTTLAPVCTRIPEWTTKKEYMKKYRSKNKNRISETSKKHYQKKKKEMFQSVLGV